MPWNIALSNNRLVVEVLAEQFRGKGNAQQNDGDAMEASTKFFYGIREHFTRLVDTKKPYDDASAKLITDLLAVDYVQSGVNEIKDIATAKERIKTLMEQCTPHKRKSEVPISALASTECNPTGAPQIDGALLVRFLAFNGQELRGGAQ